MQVLPATLTAVEGASQMFNVATFTDPGGAEAVGDFQATIDWGDGTTTITGSLALNADVFTVSGTHSYAEEGPKSPVVTITGAAVVVDAPLTGVTTAAATAGVEDVAPATLTGATFTDASIGAPLSDYSATIDWGDGSPLTPVSGAQMADVGGALAVAADHVYELAGIYAATVRIRDVGGQTATVTDMATVAPRHHQRILARAPDAKGEQDWLNYYQQQTAAGVDAPTVRYNIALFFLTSPEGFGDDVNGWFNEYFERPPTDSELQQYVNEMLAGESDRQIEQEITNVPEYGQHPTAAADGTGVRLPDYHPKPTASQQAAVAAKDSLFAQWGSAGQ